MASVLCCTTGVHLFVSESIVRHLDCFVSSPLGLWDLSLRRHAIVNNLVDELRLVKFSCFLRRLCAFMSSFITATVTSKIVSGTRTSTICSSIHCGVSFVCVQPSLLVQSMLHNVLRGSPSCVRYECFFTKSSFSRRVSEISDWLSLE